MEITISPNRKYTIKYYSESGDTPEEKTFDLPASLANNSATAIVYYAKYLPVGSIIISCEAGPSESNEYPEDWDDDMDDEEDDDEEWEFELERQEYDYDLADEDFDDEEDDDELDDYSDFED
jgi:hypothetical protein